MSSSQDPTPPTPGGPPHLDWDNVQVQHIRPVLWIYGTDLILNLTGHVISWVSPPSTAMWSWSKLGFLLEMLSLFAFFTIPGTLVAMRHPGGAIFRLSVERRFAHPRLVGLALVWAGLVLSGGTAASLFVPAPFSSISSFRYSLLATSVAAVALGVVAIAPLLALYLFDRRR